MLHYVTCFCGNRTASVHFAHLKTAEEIAQKYGVNESTVRRDEVFSRSGDKVAEEVGEEAKNYEIT